MYKKYGTILIIGQLVLLAVFCSVKGIQMNRIASMPAFQIRFMEDFVPLNEKSLSGFLKNVASGQRVVDYQLLEKEVCKLEEDEYQTLLRIVEAEAGGEDITGKILVANVVLNRVESNQFPDTVRGVVFQKENNMYQFSPIPDGRFNRVQISEETIEAVDRAINGEDLSQGALFFAARKSANPEKMKWFDNHLNRLFSYGGHEFFTLRL